MYFIEKLTVYSWLFSIWPELQRRKSKDQPNEKILLYFFDASRPGLWLSRRMAKIFNYEIKKLDFTFFDIRYKNGECVWWDMFFSDLNEVQMYLRQYPAFKEVIQRNKAEAYLYHFLIRRILYLDSDAFVLMHILLYIRVAFLTQGNEDRIHFFVGSSQRPWMSEIKKWADTRNVEIILTRGGCNLSKTMVSAKGFIKSLIKQAMFGWMGIKQKIFNLKSQEQQKQAGDSDSKIAVEFYGQLNLDSPQLNSDLFFCQQKSFLNKDILIYFQHPNLPVSDKYLDEIKAQGMSAVVINPRATTTARAPLFNYTGQLRPEDRLKISLDNKGHDDIKNDLVNQVTEYYKQKDYWYQLFKQYNVRMHVSWYKHESKYFALADALKSLGGVSVIYQRSFESAANPWTITAADVIFGFSKLGAHLGKDAVSNIPYYVVTGYLGDFRYSFAKKEADEIRAQLERHGARRILAYFDEGSADDPRRSIGHKVTQENHAFLLNKVLVEPSLGLIFKPKVYSSLRNRLGPEIAGLLQRAEETGRCFIFKEGEFHFGSHLPATAALACDIAIHGHLFAVTAGLEAALSGTPTLMLDREGCFKSPMYQLSEGQVIFRNWDDLWKACLDHWEHPQGNQKFGDWSSMINELDPFRDGLAAQRMASYLEWISQGLKAKLKPDTVLADAAERYAKVWGKDKVFSINCAPVFLKNNNLLKEAV